MEFEALVAGIDVDWVGLKQYVVKLLVTIVATYGFLYVLRYSLSVFFRKTSYLDHKKEQTIESVLKTSFNYFAFIFVLITAIKPFVEIGELLVAGGVLGVVIGFGAQSAIKDMLYGFFFLFESQFRKGDFVRINDDPQGGTVEELGFRALKIRNLNGMVTTISNGEIRKVVNGNVESRRIYEGLIVSFRQNPREVKELLGRICDQLNEAHKDFLKKDRFGEYIETYQVHGLSSIDVSPLGYRFIVVATVNDEDYIRAVQETKEALAQGLYDNNIKMPEQNIFFRKEE